MSGRNVLLALALAFLVGPIAVSYSAAGLQAAGWITLAGDSQEKWRVVNITVLSWLLSIALWVAYAVHRLLYRPGL